MAEVVTLVEGLPTEVRQAMTNPTRSSACSTSTQTTHTGSAPPPHITTISLGKTSAYGSTHDIKRTGQDLQVGEGILRLASVMMAGRPMHHMYTARNLVTTFSHLTDTQAAHRLCLLNDVQSTKTALYFDKQGLNEFLQVGPESKDRHQPRHSAAQSPKQQTNDCLGPNRGKKGKLKVGKVPTERRCTTPDSEAKTFWASSLGPEIYLD
jgi:hypothetical protein